VESEGVPLEQVIEELKQLLPQDAILVGLNIQQDVQWLKLQEGVDFQVKVFVRYCVVCLLDQAGLACNYCKPFIVICRNPGNMPREARGSLIDSRVFFEQGLLDLQGLYQVQHPKFRTPTRFGLAHLAKVLLNLPTTEPHDAVDDAWKSIKLWNLYRELEADPERFEKCKVSASIAHLGAILLSGPKLLGPRSGTNDWLETGNILNAFLESYQLSSQKLKVRSLFLPLHVLNHYIRLYSESPVNHLLKSLNGFLCAGRASEHTSGPFVCQIKPDLRWRLYGE
jgi:hypothetical protein